MTIVKHYLGIIFITCILISCSNSSVQESDKIVVESRDSVNSIVVVDTRDSGLQHPSLVPHHASTQIVDFAETLIGVPYKYASSDPAIGFDCSGFISYVYHHFKIDVPRSSVDFTDVGTEIPLNNAKRGDLILFTGTDNTLRVVGHMGIVTDNSDSLHFIHATSGKQYAVTVTPLNEYYMKRFVKITRL